MSNKVGLTGGIGSGKSTVGRLFTDLGVTVIDADQIARKVTAAGTPALREIRDHFGADCILSDGNLDRKSLGKKVFNHPAERRWLEQLLHPLIRKESDLQADMAEAPFCILEIPLLIETGRHSEMAAVIVVDCDMAIRQQRLVQNRGMDVAAIQRIVDTQATDEERLAAADYVISNNGDESQLAPQVRNVFRQLEERFG